VWVAHRPVSFVDTAGGKSRPSLLLEANKRKPGRRVGCTPPRKPPPPPLRGPFAVVLIAFLILTFNPRLVSSSVVASGSVTWRPLSDVACGGLSMPVTWQGSCRYVVASVVAGVGGDVACGPPTSFDERGAWGDIQVGGVVVGFGSSPGCAISRIRVVTWRGGCSRGCCGWS